MKEARYIKNSTLAVYSGSWVGLHFPASTPARAGSHKNATEPAILPAMRAPPLANSEPQVSHLCPLWNPPTEPCAACVTTGGPGADMCV
jgi:hypothetical protein